MFGLFKKKVDVLYAPVNGKLLAIGEVSDPVFSQKMMGDGFAIEPTDSAIFSPVEGTVASIFPTKHAITLKTKNGVDVLLHMGIDTVALKGEGFEILVEEGQKVSSETQLAVMDIAYLEQQEKPTTVIVVLPEFQGEFTLDTTGELVAKQEIGSLK